MATPARITRRTLLVASAATLAVPSFASAAPARKVLTADPVRVRGWAKDTWRSLVAMTPSRTGLPADNIPESLAASDRSGYTSPTNIGGYLWSAIVARELGLITSGEASARLVRTLSTLDRMEHHTPSGMYYNWYDEETGEALRAWPGTGAVVHPFCSSVDNGWLGAALRVVAEADRAASGLAKRIFGRMRWDAFYNPGDDPAHPVRPGGLIHGGFFPFDHDRPGGVYQGTHIGGDPVWLTTHHYDTTVSETRITSYLGIITGQIPPKQYFAMWRTLPHVVRLVVARDAAGGGEPDLLRHRGLRGRLHLSRHADRAGLGRFDVRGADAGRVRARGEVGAAVVGPQPPVARPGSAGTRSAGSEVRLLGLQPGEQPGRMGTASTASTRWASGPAASPATRPAATSPTRR